MRHVPDPNASDVRTLLPVAGVALLVAVVGVALLFGSGGPIAVTATAHAHDPGSTVPEDVHDLSTFERGHPVREAAVAAHERGEPVTVNGTVTDRSKVNVGSSIDSSTLYVRVDGEILAVEVRKRG